MTARHCVRGRASVLAIGILTSVLFTCSLAHAQVWLPDREYTEGPGFKAGLFEIHPGLAVRGGYNDNLFLSDGVNNPKIGTGVLSVSPHLNISTRKRQREVGGEGAPVGPPPKIRLSSGVSGNLLWYSADEAPPVNFGVDFNGALEIMPERVVGAEITASYQRKIQPFTEQVGADQNYVSNNVSVGALAKFQSKGGVWVTTAGYRPTFEIYGADTPFGYLNNYQHVIPVNMGWKFLPHTSLLYDGQVEIRNYTNEDEIATGQAGVLFTDSRSFRSRLGLNGSLTKHISLRLMAGAAYGFYEPVPTLGYEAFDEYQEPIGQAVFNYTFGARKSKLELMYEHDIQNSGVGAWIQRDRGSAKLDLNLLSMLSLGFEVGAGGYRYGNMLSAQGNPLGVNGSDTRKDIRVDGAVRAEYRATNWLALMLDASYILDDTSFEYASDPDNTGVSAVPPDPAGYKRFEVFAGVRAHY